MNAMNGRMKVMKNFELVNERLEKLERIMKKLLDIEESDIHSNYSPSSESEDSLEFKEFQNEDIWETNKNENKECNECGSVNIKKDAECEGDEFVFWCNECNCHVGASENENDKKDEKNEKDDFEWCYECDYFEIKSCELCERYVSKKRNIEDIESDTENDYIKTDFKKIKYF